MNTFEKKLQVLLKYPEMIDFIEVLIAGAKKHGDENWLKADGSKQSISSNSKSMAHHLLDVRAGVAEDEQSGLAPELHLACRALMGYTRKKRSLVHPDDSKLAIESKKLGLYDDSGGSGIWTTSDAGFIEELRSHEFPRSYVCQNNKCRCNKEEKNNEEKE